MGRKPEAKSSVGFSGIVSDVILASFCIAATILSLYSTGYLHSDHRSAGYNSSLLYNVRNVDGWKEYDMIVVTDLDHESKHKNGKQWMSTARAGVLRVRNDGNSAEVTWKKEDIHLTSQLASGGRAMELSDLAVFDGRLFSVDDRTGIIYEIMGTQVVPWVLLNDGPGNTAKTFKGEWMTVKDKRLIVGGLGKEWTTTEGVYVNDNPMWVKVVDRFGGVEHKPWKEVFVQVRRALGIEYPGYMIHEAVQWSDVHRKWFFLPRRASKDTYTEEEDELRGTNAMIVADEHFTEFKAVHIGKLEDTRRGFSAFQFIPGTNDQLIVALRSSEKDGVPVASYITIFDVNGNVIMEDQSLHEAHKFEGIAFV